MRVWARHGSVLLRFSSLRMLPNPSLLTATTRGRATCRHEAGAGVPHTLLRVPQRLKQGCLLRPTEQPDEVKTERQMDVMRSAWCSAARRTHQRRPA